MIKMIRSLILSIIIASVLASCSLFPNTTDAPLISDSSQDPSASIQPTAALAELVVIELTVQADTSVPFNTVGQVIKYSYTIKNTGSTGVPAGLPTDVIVTGATVTCPAVNTIGNNDGTLDGNEALVCTSDYTITQADLDKGSVTNIATATVYGISSIPVTTTVATVQPVVLKLTKTANPITYDHVGQTVTYTYVITNSSAATLGPAQFTVSDTGISALINCGEATLSLASNLTVTCSATYTVTQADMNAASVATNATASVGSVPPSQPASATITKSNNPFTLGATIQHKVVSGEWLWQIARCYGADPAKVLQANPQLSNPGQISPNTTVTVPNIGSVGKIYGTPCVGTHTVQPGDTWSSIALKYNADSAILQMVNANTLTVGKVLKVPLNSASLLSSITPTPTPTISCPLPSGWIEVIVQAGDTLNTLAIRYGTTPEILSQQNCLVTTDILVGSRIYVPPVPTITPIP